MRQVIRFSVGCMMVVSLVVVCSGASADATDETIRAQLAALKELCDKGLVSPEVCAEKQRDILGLTPRMSAPPPPAGGPRVRGGAPGAPRPTDSVGSARPAPSATPSGSPPAPAGGADAPAGSIRESALGFRMSLPDGWTSISSKDMRKGFAALADQMADSAETRRVWERLIDNAEVYMREGEQLTVQARAGAVPQSAAEGQTLCQTLAGTLSQVAKRPLTTHECGLVKVAGVTTLLVDQEALVAGRRTVQVWLENEAGMLQFTMNCKDENVTDGRS
jgi:hypothetical protein